MRFRHIGALASCALLSTPAFGQTPTQTQTQTVTPPAAPASTVSSLTVTGQRAAVTTSIDRRTYNVARDLNAATGSIVDVMRNVPSVAVDVEGNISVRGEGVQILIDGKRSSMLEGPDRALFLQQIPASTIESLEVITNPSAEFAPDGAGGIINIVTKKVRSRGATGAIQAGFGSYGRGVVTALGAYAKGPLSVSGTFGARTQTDRTSGSSVAGRIDPILNLRTDTVSGNSGEVERPGVQATTTLDYDITKADRLTLGLTLSVPQTETTNHYREVRRDAGGVVERDFTIDLDGSLDGLSGGLSAGWRHSFAERGREFSLTVRDNEASSTSRNRLLYTYAAPAKVEDVRRLTENDGSQRTLSAAYTDPLPGNSVLKLGYDYRRDDIGQDFRGAQLDAQGVPVNLVNYSNHFVFVDSNHQVYATLQRPFGKLTVLAGLRLEAAFTDYDQLTTGVRGEEDYRDIHPSLHLEYALSAHHSLNASYSHRVTRPNNSQRNPFLVISNEFTATSGNPALRPQETHSFEAGWRWQEDASNASATLFYRQNYNTIASVNRFLTPVIILNTYDNLGDSRSGGLDLNAGGRMGTPLTWRANGTVFYNELQRSTLGGGDTRSALAYSVTGTVDYRPTAKDLVQLSGAYAGKALSNQGYRLPMGALNIGYQRKFSPNLIGVITVSDIFASMRSVTVLDTQTLFGSSTTRPAGRTFSLGISRTFGGRPVRDGQFEYDAPQL